LFFQLNPMDPIVAQVQSKKKPNRRSKRGGVKVRERINKAIKKTVELINIESD
jgi:hypothetical protein